MLSDTKYDITKEATEILEKEGIDRALEYLRSKDLERKEKLLNKNMKELAQKYKLEANLLMLKNRYKEAKDALKKVLKYDRSAENIFNYAKFLQEQHYFNEAKDAYKEALKIYKALAKENPRVYRAYVATTLNNLANLYRATNEMQKAKDAYKEALKIYKALAKENPRVYRAYVATILNNLALLYRATNEMQKAKDAYKEALKIRRALAKENFNVYGIDLARTLIIGALLGSKNNLKEAKEILDKFNTYEAKGLKKLIDSLEKK